MTKLVIQPMDNLVERFGNQLGALGEKQARIVLVRAVNRVTDMAYTRVVREIAKQSSIPQAIVRKATFKHKASIKGGGPIEGVIRARGDNLSLKFFKPRQFSWGVRAKVWGKFQRFEHAFIYGGRWNSGKPAFHGHVMERVGKDRFPVSRIKGPAVPDEMVRDKTFEAFNSLVAEHLPKRVSHEISRLLNP